MPKSLILTILLLFAATGLTMVKPGRAQSPPASPSGNLIDLTESVKQRIKNVISDQSELNNLKVAFGKLVSVSNNTLSIEGENAVQLASTSAQTQFLRLPGNTQLSLEDLAIDEYLIVVGTDQKPVLNAAKVISQKSPPSPGTQTTFFGLIDQYDTKTFELNLIHPLTQESQTFTLGRQTDLYLSLPDGTKQSVNRSQDFPLQSQALVIYEPETDPEADLVADEILVLPSSPIITPPELAP